MYRISLLTSFKGYPVMLPLYWRSKKKKKKSQSVPDFTKSGTDWKIQIIIWGEMKNYMLWIKRNWLSFHHATFSLSIVKNFLPLLLWEAKLKCESQRLWRILVRVTFSYCIDAIWLVVFLFLIIATKIYSWKYRILFRHRPSFFHLNDSAHKCNSVSKSRFFFS